MSLYFFRIKNGRYCGASITLRLLIVMQLGLK